MRYFDKDEAKRLQPEPWMVRQLKMNPSYISWGPHEDYMWNKHEGWDAPVYSESWQGGRPQLDDLNEVVNFYFEIQRPAERCKTCGGTSHHPDAQWITESFYSHSSPFKHKTRNELEAEAVLASFDGPNASPRPTCVLESGGFPSDEVLERYGQPFHDFCVRTMERGGYWMDDITEDEAAELVTAGRGRSVKTAAEFNRANVRGRGFLDDGNHDSINRWILIKQRCKRLGVPLECPNPACYDGRVFTGAAYLALILWVLHPRKGCSRGWEIKNIQQAELPEVYSYLREAAQRNAQRFRKVPRQKREGQAQ